MPGRFRVAWVGVGAVVAMVVAEGIAAPVAESAAAPVAATVTATAPAPALALARGATPPHAPFLEYVAGTGLGVLAAWTPASAADKVTGFSVAARPMAGAPKSCGAKSVTAAASNTQAIVGGLCAGVAYHVTVKARNAAGASLASRVSGPVVPLAAQVPGVPLLTSVLARNESLAITWARPSYSGGRPLTGYRLTATGGGKSVTVKAGAKASAATVAGLVNGTAYRLSLSAISAVGSSRAATGSGTPARARAPSPPADLTVVPDGKGHLVASWPAPADDGGSPVTRYAISYQQATLDGSTGQWTPVPAAPVHTVTVKAPALTATASAFESQQAYYLFTITAANAAGTSTPTAQAAAVTPTVTVGAKATVLGAATVAALTGATAKLLTWKDPAPAQARQLAPGRTIVAAPGRLLPHGALRTVVSVADKGGTLTVTTQPGTLSGAFSALGMDAGVNPVSRAAGDGLVHSASAARPRFVPSVAGVRVIPAAGVGFGDSVTLSVDLKVGHVSVAAEASLTASVSVYLGVHKGFAGVPDGVSVSAAATVKAALSGTVQVEGDLWSTQIGEIVGTPVDVQVGPVPVVVVPVVPVFLTLTGRGGMGIEVSGTVGGEVSWSSGAGKLQVRNLSTGPAVGAQVVPGITATGELDLHLDVQPQADIYDAAGPNVDAELDDTARVNFLPKPGDPFLSVGQQLQLKAGVDLHLLGVHESLEATIGSFAFGSFIIKNPPTAAYTITPANPVARVGGTLALKATRDDGKTAKLTWRLVGGTRSDTISNAGVLHASAPAGRTLTVTVSDASGAAGETAVTVGPAFGSPADVTAIPAPGGTGATVSWIAPSATGGSALSGYMVLTQPSTGTHRAGATATTLALPSLAHGTYTIAVYAVNKAGQQSAPGTTEIMIGARSVSGWSVNKPGLPADAGTGQTDAPGIACGGGSCIGATSYTDKAGNGQVALYQLTAGGWPVTEAPRASGEAAKPNNPYLSTLACAGDGFCTAEGDMTDSRGNLTAILWSLAGGRWTVKRAPLPATSLGYLVSDANNLTCGQDLCAAQAWEEDKSGNYWTWFFWTWTPSTGWTDAKAPIPKGIQSNSIDTGSRPLACGLGVCVEDVRYEDSASDYHLLVWTWTAKTGWSATVAALPPTAVLADDSPADVSCGTDVCVMAGSYGYTSQNVYLTALWTWTPGNGWTLQAKPPVPAADAADAFISSREVSCGYHACAVIGDADPSGLFMWTWTPGTGWRAGTLSVPSATPSATNPVVYQVSCGQAACAAIGTYTDTTTGLTPISLWTWAAGGTAWVVNDIPPFAQADPDPSPSYYNFFVSVSCGPVTCAATSSYDDLNLGHTQAVLWSWSPSAGWTHLAAPPLPADAAAQPNPYSYEASCGLASCVAVGSYFTTSSAELGILWTSGNGTGAAYPNSATRVTAHT